MIRVKESGRLAKYGLVGILNTGVDFAVFCLLVYVAGFGTVSSQGIAYGAGLLNSYLWNRHWTFQVKEGRIWLQLGRFVLVNAFSFGIATAVLLTLEHGGMPAVVSKIVSIGASFVFNYIGYRIWVFRVMRTRSNHGQ